MISNEKILVTKTFLPPLNEYMSYMEEIFATGWLTNNGKHVVELERELAKELDIDKLLFCTNGTVVLDMAIKVLNLTNEIITTPFSYVATLNSILWRDCKPIFVDINESDCNINCDLIEEKITANTQAILVTHVYGNPCDVIRLEKIANKYNLKVIYDAAHAFGVKYKGSSIFNYGDISTCSFHATKIFHTVEGGALFTNHSDLFDQLYKMRQFGHIYDDYYLPGINAKNSEVHAAMGLCVLNHFNEILVRRRAISELYDNTLNYNIISKPVAIPDTQYNFAYYPIILPDETTCLKVIETLNRNNIYPRRYFYPSLNTLPYLSYQECPVSERISKSVLSLPLYFELSDSEVESISSLINNSL